MSYGRILVMGRMWVGVVAWAARVRHGIWADRVASGRKGQGVPKLLRMAGRPAVQGVIAKLSGGP